MCDTNKPAKATTVAYSYCPSAVHYNNPKNCVNFSQTNIMKIIKKSWPPYDLRCATLNSHLKYRQGSRNFFIFSKYGFNMERGKNSEVLIRVLIGQHFKAVQTEDG